MFGTIYLDRGDAGMVALTETAYDSEALLQGLLEKYPALLAGEQMTEGAARRWLLVRREAAMAAGETAGTWYVDHLFLDQDGIPTLVEVKRSSDARIRREVVGQMLDYAAGCGQWTVEDLRARFEAGSAAEERMAEFLGEEERAGFWEKVRLNLASRRLRLVFVADEIPAELRRVVEFLAEQFRSVEIYAVEVRKFACGEEKVYVPQLVSRPKESPASAVAGRQWDEASFFEALRGASAEDVAVARRLVEWSRRWMPALWYGKGTTQGSIVPQMVLGNGSKPVLFALWSSGAVEMYFQHMGVPPLDRMEVRVELMERLNRIPGIQIGAGALAGRPKFAMAALRGEAEARAFEEAMEWALGQVKEAGLDQG